MTARFGHTYLHDHAQRQRELAERAARIERRRAFFRPFREGFVQAFRDCCSLLRNPLFWALAFVMWLAMNYGRVG